MMSYREIARADLTADEGRRNGRYSDSRGVETIGIGHNLSKPISDRAVDVIFDDDLADAERDARALFPAFDTFSDNRKAVLLNLSFNMGGAKLSKFLKMCAAVNTGRWSDVADELVDSAWFRQVQESRSSRLIRMIREG
jgi:GH24 family phage-related lysozyme (muramidase)